MFCFQVALSFILAQAEATLFGLVQTGQELAGKLRVLQVDRREIACLKFLLLFNPSECLTPTREAPRVSAAEAKLGLACLGCSNGPLVESE